MPKYPYRNLGTFFDRIFRNGINDNFKDIETDFKEVEAKSIERDNELDSRIDNIVANSGGTVTEIVDGRNNSVNDKIYATLRDRLDNDYKTVTDQLADKAKKGTSSIIKCGFVPNFIKKCLDGNAYGAWLGDSITVGGGTSDPTSKGYAYLVTDKLQDKYGRGIVMDNRGHGGYKASRLLAEIVPTEILPYDYDFISVACGTNDWNYSTSLTQFEIDYRSLIEKLISETNADIICIGIGWFSDWVSPTSNPISETEYNKVIQKICSEYGLGYIDTYNAMKNSGYTFEEMTYAPDRVHPNDLGAEIWSDEIFSWFDFQGSMFETSPNKFVIEHQWAADPGITYTGIWAQEGPYASTFNKKTMNTSGAGNKATYKFTGKKIKVYFVKDKDRGQAKIKLDGVVIHSLFETYSPSFDFTPLILDMEYGTHTLEIEVLGTKNNASTGTKISLSVIDNYTDPNSDEILNDVPYVLPEDFIAYPGKAIDTNAGYYFGKGASVAGVSDTVLGSLSTKVYGTKFKIFYTKYPSYGIFDVYVDGEKKATIDAYASTAQFKNMIEITDLSLENHLIELKTSGTKNAVSSGYGMTIEGVLCYNSKREVLAEGTDNVPITFQFYEKPNIQVTATFNGTARVSSKTEKSVTVLTTPSGGTFDLVAKGY
jgi:lysophospholipase L1-like esterase